MQYRELLPAGEGLLVKMPGKDRKRNSYNPEQILDQKIFTQEIHLAVESLPLRDKDIIKSRFGFKEERDSLQKLGNKYAISAEAARQIEKRAINLMRVRFPYLIIMLPNE